MLEKKENFKRLSFLVNVLSKFMILCWTASIAGLDHVWLTGHSWTCLKSQS